MADAKTDYERQPFSHVRDRAKERYGLNLSPRDVIRLGYVCADEERRVVLRKGTPSNPAHTLLVKFMGKVLPVVWDETTGHVITILPPDYKLKGNPKADINHRRRYKRRAIQRNRERCNQ